MDVDTEDRVESHSQGPKPYDDLWFPDGNVVLATDTYLFKVFKGLLSKNSSVFRDMFELPHVGSVGSAAIAGQDVDEGGGIGMDTELYEGLPVVTMVDDKGEDVAHLLRVIFEHSYYDRHSDETPLDVVIALLTLSTKYDFKTIRKDVIIQISEHYPMSLEKSEKLDCWPHNRDPLFRKERWECHIPLLAAALTANVEPLLPILDYSCTFNSMSILVRDPILTQISPEYFHTLLIGRESLHAKVAVLIADLPQALLSIDASSVCLQGETCLKKARYVELSHLVNLPFYATKGKDIMDSDLGEACVPCKSLVERSIDKQRRRIWDRIPSLFGCPSWEVAEAKLKEIKES